MKTYEKYGISVEVSDEMYEELVAIDKKIANGIKKEIRRHISLEAANKDDVLFPSKDNVEEEVIRKAEAERAQTYLLPDQKVIVDMYFYCLPPRSEPDFWRR